MSSKLDQHEPMIPEQEIEEGLEFLENYCKTRQQLADQAESEEAKNALADSKLGLNVMNKYGDANQILDQMQQTQS